MTFKLNKIYYLSFFLFLTVLFSGCSGSDQDSPLNTKEVTWKMHLSPLTRDAAEADLETINTVRIILTDNSDKIIYNNLLSFNGVQSKDFSHTETFTTSAGKKNLFVIANEESIVDYNYSEENNFSNLLNSYTTGRSGFEDFINSVYFTPDYTRPLPATCYYKLNIEQEGEEHTAYMVNVATKFKIILNNYRNDEVIFNQISLSSIADRNFLMAKIDEENQFIKDTYWIDWLQKTVEDTNDSSLDDPTGSNNAINEKWGWLTDYNMPEGTTHSIKYFIPEKEKWIVEKAIEKEGDLPEAKVLEKGPFYFPESKFIPDVKTNQSYTLDFEIQMADGHTKTLSKPLPYIKTLFRNTYVIFNVEMDNATEDIYVEVRNWENQDKVYGTIVQE